MKRNNACGLLGELPVGFLIKNPLSKLFFSLYLGLCVCVPFKEFSYYILPDTFISRPENLRENDDNSPEIEQPDKISV